MSMTRTAICTFVVLAGLGRLSAQVTLAGRVEIEGGRPGRSATLPSTVVWLTPLGDTGNQLPAVAPVTDGSYRLVQKNKSFQPHILVVPVGSVVAFPNSDPFFHNVFSLFEGKRFDLGLYEAGTSRMVHFDRQGVSYIFCNIHPDMSAVIITLATPLYAISSSTGQLSIAQVPYGRYLLHIWSEHGAAEQSQTTTREITISENSATLGVIRVPAADRAVVAHKNKYGRDYDTPTPDSSVYREQR